MKPIDKSDFVSKRFTIYLAPLTKKLWIATGREHNIMRYSFGTSIRDAHVYSDEEAKEILMKRGYSEAKAERFIQAVKENPFTDWIEF